MHPFVVTVLLLCSFICNHGASAQTYAVKKVLPGAVTVSGTGQSAAWLQANILTHFIYPWEKEKPPATAFAALWDGQWLYCLFTVTDDSVIIYRINNDKRETGASDRVEIFFKADDNMSPYYCLEMDAAGRTLDYSANYYRLMQYHWNWPKEQLIIKTARTANGYQLEAAIGIATLQQLGLLKDNQLQAGLFRAERTGTQNGKADVKWISWVDPKSDKPDFHIPAAFGILKLE